MNQATKLHPDFLTAFHATRAAVMSGATFDQGICGVVGGMLKRLGTPEEARGDGMDWLVRCVWPRWQYFAGSTFFPIPGGMREFLQYPSRRWKGEQREYRLNLINFTIHYLETGTYENPATAHPAGLPDTPSDPR